MLHPFLEVMAKEGGGARDSIEATTCVGMMTLVELLEGI